MAAPTGGEATRIFVSHSHVDNEFGVKLVQDLRAAGLMVDYSLTAAKPDKQFKRAQELKAGHTVKLERSQTGEVVAKLKNLKTREEKAASPAEAVKELGGACS